MKKFYLNGQLIGWSTLEDVNKNYPGAKKYESPYIISIIYACPKKTS